LFLRLAYLGFALIFPSLKLHNGLSFDTEHPISDVAAVSPCNLGDEHGRNVQVVLQQLFPLLLSDEESVVVCLGCVQEVRLTTERGFVRTDDGVLPEDQSVLLHLVECEAHAHFPLGDEVDLVYFLQLVVIDRVFLFEPRLEDAEAVNQELLVNVFCLGQRVELFVAPHPEGVEH